MDILYLTRPDDWHLHLRDGVQLSAVLLHTAARFARAMVMPNLKPPLITTAAALAYRERIRAALPADANFTPLMTLYLTENTSPEEIARARESGAVYGVKLYPAGATTHSEAGVRDLGRIYPVLEAMVEYGLPLLVHGEVTDPKVDIFDRERIFIERYLVPLVERLPNLKLVLEHITTREAVVFVREASPQVAATITPHHLLFNRNALFQGGLCPHYYCLPVLKREVHRRAVLEAALSGNPKFFLGTDSAPHPRTSKESGCGCAGIYSAHAALELYAEIFAEEGLLDRLEGFASHHGADFHGLPRNQDQIVLERIPWTVPQEFSFGNDRLIPLRAGEKVAWRLRSN
ncbi:dihydroorotase [Gammaproteobacteria bacterium]